MLTGTLRPRPLAILVAVAVLAATLITTELSPANASSATFTDDCLPAPALPDVSVADPGKTVVRVSNEGELQSAVSNIEPNTVVMLAPGTYELSRTLYIHEDDVTLRGDSTRCDAVVLVGQGMDNASGRDAVPHGIWTDRRNTKVQNLSIRDVYDNAIHINGGAQSPEMYNLALLDAGTQFIKSNPVGFGNGVDRGVIDYVAIDYSNGTPRTDHGAGTGYGGALSVHGGDGWVIKNSRISNINPPDGSDHLFPPAILMWNGSSNTTVESTVFVNNSRAIAFGLEASRAGDHSGGVIRNNMVVMTPGAFSTQRAAQSDAAILVWNSPGTEVLQNSIVVGGNAPKSIELRFNSPGGQVHNNLVDAPIVHRNGESFSQSGNVLIDVHNVVLPVPAAPAPTPLPEIVSAPPAPTHEPTPQPELGPEPQPAPTPAPKPQPAPEPPAPTQPAEGTLVSQNDLTYQGSFRVPYGDGSSESSLSWGGAGLGYNPNRDSLFITGHNWHQLTAEISIPALGQSPTPLALPQASFLQRPEDAADGKLPAAFGPDGSSFERIGGYLVDGDDLIVSGYNFYDAANQQRQSHLVTDIDLGSSSDFVALTDQVQPRWLSGAMTNIPAAWQAAFGGDTFMTGLSGISIVSNSSVGPSAATFTRQSLTGSNPAELVLGYPLSDPLDDYEAQSELWNGTSEVRGMVFPEETSSVLYFGTHGVGEFCYGTGPDCDDPVSPHPGTHAYPYRYQVWAYDAADLAEVYAGNAEPESVRPYDVWELDLPYSPSTMQIGGASYDPTTGRIFVSQAFADGENPVIHVFTLD